MNHSIAQKSHKKNHVNRETLGLALFTATQIRIFSTRFKAFETEFTAKSSLRISLTIHMDLSQRITRVGKDPYFLEVSELHKIGAHAQPLPRRSTLLLAPSRTDGPNGRKSREKALFLSLEYQKLTLLHVCSSFGEESYSFLFYSLNFFSNSICVPSFNYLIFLTHGLIQVIHLHHLTNHAICVTRVHVVGDLFKSDVSHK